MTADAGLAGAITVEHISCYETTLAGDMISVDGHPAGHTSLRVIVDFLRTSVKVTVSNVPPSGFVNQNEFAERQFSGSGVSGFDSHRGVTVNSSLSGGAPSSTFGGGTIGAVASIGGQVDCGNQKSGTSSIVISGNSQEGQVDGSLSPVRVECETSTQPGRTVSLDGLSYAGSTRVRVDVFISDALITVDISSPSIPSSYVSDPQVLGVVAINTNGVHIDTSLAEQADHLYSLHLSGDAICGSTVKVGV